MRLKDLPKVTWLLRGEVEPGFRSRRLGSTACTLKPYAILPYIFLKKKTSFKERVLKRVHIKFL